MSTTRGGPIARPGASGVRRCQKKRITPRQKKLPTRVPTPTAIAEIGSSGPTGLSASRPSRTSVPTTLAETSEGSSSRVLWRIRRWSLS